MLKNEAWKWDFVPHREFITHNMTLYLPIVILPHNVTLNLAVMILFPHNCDFITYICDFISHNDFISCNTTLNITIVTLKPIQNIPQ